LLENSPSSKEKPEGKRKHPGGSLLLGTGLSFRGYFTILEARSEGNLKREERTKKWKSSRKERGGT